MVNPEDLTGRLVASFHDDKAIPAINKRLLDEHLNHLRAKGAAAKTVQKHVYCLRRFMDGLGRTDCRKATGKDIERAMAQIESAGLGIETKRHIKAVVKAFYKHLLGEDMYYPKQVAWLKTSGPKSKKMLPEGILSEDDIAKMLNSASNVRDKAIIALLFDSGMRIGELLNLRARDVELDQEPAHITVSGKTGMRRIPLLFSVPYIAVYLNTIKDRKPSEPLFNAIGTWSNMNQPVERGAVAKALRLVAKKAGVTKPVNPHAFRHARATYYASRLTEQQLKAFFGWTGDSKMASTYVHLSGRDIDNAVMRAYGMAKAEEDSKPKLVAVKCARCREPNAMGAQYCMRCGAALTPRLSVEQGEAEDSLRKSLVDAIDDPKLVEDLVHAYLEKKRKR